jgi:hypothetical protein
MRLKLFTNRLKFRKLLECAGPPALWQQGLDNRKRQRTGAVQDAAALWSYASKKRLLGLIVLAATFEFARAQTPPPADPLIQLMQSQPPVDISSPVTVTTSFDPPLVRPGETAVYRVTLNATEASIRLPDEIPAPAGLKLQRSASGQMMQPAGGAMRPVTTYVYVARASAQGVFTVPEFTAEVYGQPVVVPSARLEAQPELGQHEPARQLFLETAATNVFVGETLNVRVLLPSSTPNVAESLMQVQFNGDGFVADKNIARQAIQPLERNGRRVPTYIYETTVTPITSGTMSLSAQGFTAGMQFSGPIVISGQVSIPGGQPRYLLLDSESIDINVRPLPTDDELPGFTGTIGSYVCGPPGISTNTVAVGDPVQLTFVVQGQQNLNRITPPPPPRVKGWQIFPAVRGGIVEAGGPANRGAVFSYTLIPMTDEVSATPAIPFSCFDPQRAAYLDLTIQPVPITVISGGQPANEEPPVVVAENPFEPEKKLALSKLAQSPGRTTGSLVPLQLRGWFPLIQLIPALGFCGLWFWDRRRRFLELHPEIVRRRRARRELRRIKPSLRRAAASGDAPGFARVAVNAMQIACAPHFPAEPRALVCGDVLEILSATERRERAGETVRQIFSAADAASFAVTPQIEAELLTKQSGLEEILAKLEARL